MADMKNSAEIVESTEAAQETSGVTEENSPAHQPVEAGKAEFPVPPVPAGASGRDEDLEYFIEQIASENTRQYIRTRVVKQMKYYSKQSRACKKQFQRLTAASIILGALIPVASIFSDISVFMKVAIAALGSGVTAINAFLALYNSKDLWLTYRNTRETLLRTLYYYFNHTGSFAADRSGRERTQDELDKLLIQCCEKELASENGSWRSIVEE